MDQMTAQSFGGMPESGFRPHRSALRAFMKRLTGKFCKDRRSGAGSQLGYCFAGRRGGDVALGNGPGTGAVTRGRPRGCGRPRVSLGGGVRCLDAKCACVGRGCGDRQEQEGKRLPVGALHALRGWWSLCGHREPAGPDAATEQGLAGIPCGGTVEGLAHADLVRVSTRRGRLEVDTRPPRGTVVPGVTVRVPAILSGSASGH